MDNLNDCNAFVRYRLIHSTGSAHSSLVNGVFKATSSDSLAYCTKESINLIVFTVRRLFKLASLLCRQQYRYQE